MLHSEAGWRVGEPSFVTYRREPPASRTARFRTTCRSKSLRRPAQACCGGRAALALLMRLRRVGSGPGHQLDRK